MSLIHITYVLLRLILSNMWISNIFITQFFPLVVQMVENVLAMQETWV